MSQEFATVQPVTAPGLSPIGQEWADKNPELKSIHQLDSREPCMVDGSPDSNCKGDVYLGPTPTTTTSRNH
jgi:hypothetical protein